MIIKDKNILKILSLGDKRYPSLINKARNEDNCTINNEWTFYGALEYWTNINNRRGTVINAKDLLKINYCTKFPDLETLVPYKIENNIKLYYPQDEDNIVFNKYPSLLFNGILRCEIVGIQEPCIGFFWVMKKIPIKVISSKDSKVLFEGIYGVQKGLVCLFDDKVAINSAWYRYRVGTEL